ncbi:flippase [Desulfoluna limicola]|nr:flippase [Desulfoluna limicola]
MKYLKNTSWLFVEKLFRVIVGLLVSFWVVRYLGPEKFGLLSYAQSFVGLFIAISTLGLDGIVVRELVKDEGKRDAIVGTAFILKLLGSFGVLFVLAISFYFTSNDTYTNSLMMVIASATIFQSFNVIDFYFQSQVLSRFIVFVNIISLLFSSVVKIILIINEAPLIAFAYVIVFDSIVMAIGFVYIYIKSSLSIKKWKYDKFLAVALLKDSWPLVFGTIAASIYMQIDQVMIKEIMDSTAVGYYAVSSRLSEVWLFITVLITKSLLPLIINAKKQSETLFLYRMQYLYNLLVKIAFFISVLISFFAQDIVVILFGEQYLQSVPILIIYVWSIVFVYISNASTSYFLAENMQFHASLRLVFGAVINIALNMMWIKSYGLNGAAYSTLCSYAFSSYFYNILFRSTYENFKMQTKSIINIFNVFSYKQILQIR